MVPKRLTTPGGSQIVMSSAVPVPAANPPTVTMDGLVEMIQAILVGRSKYDSEVSCLRYDLKEMRQYYQPDPRPVDFGSAPLLVVRPFMRGLDFALPEQVKKFIRKIPHGAFAAVNTTQNHRLRLRWLRKSLRASEVSMYATFDRQNCNRMLCV